MKIDKRKPVHWIYLFLFAVNVSIALVLRLLLRGSARKRVLLYGHKFSGNLLSIAREMLCNSDQEFDARFLTMDPTYHRELLACGESSLLAISPRSIPWLATAHAVISDHGLHALLPMLYLSKMKFFDVWHGIPFKGFDADDFRVQHRYDEVWVASPLLGMMYRERFGFSCEQVEITGYARTDRLVRGVGVDRAAIARRLGLPLDAGKIVLFAPTWQQDDCARSVFPFGTDANAFCAALSQLAERLSATVVLRTHLNSGSVASIVDRYPRLVGLPYTEYPDTEEILLISDILVCDWSSIAFDFLLLERPTIFLDVKAPFQKGFSLDGSYRYGAIAPGLAQFMDSLARYVVDPSEYEREHGAYARSILQRVYGEFADGRCSSRCVERLLTHITAT